MAPLAFISRKETFSCAHRLHSTHLTEEENRQVFGKCNWANGHGHNYTVEVVVKGPINPVTGLVMNLVDLKHVIKTHIMDVLDHKNLDKDVPFFSDKTSSAENVVVFCWQALMGNLRSDSASLYEIRLHETEKNVVIYRGE